MPSFSTKRVLRMTKGFTARNKNTITAARARLEKALHYSYVGRKLKKRENRSLWIQQINAGTREHGLQYSTFVRGLVESDIALNRKMLSELAQTEPLSFYGLVQHVKSLNVDERRLAKIAAHREGKKKEHEDVIKGVETRPWALTLHAEKLLQKRVQEALTKQGKKDREATKKAANQQIADKRRVENSERKKQVAARLREEAIQSAMATARAVGGKV